MSTRKGMTTSAGRSVLLATVAALCFSAASPSLAAPVTGSEATVTTASSRATDFSAARRHHHHYHHYYAGNGPAAFVGAAVGLVGGAIAAGQREYYDWGPYGPGYYNGPVYYNPYYPYEGRGYYDPF